VGDIIFVRRSNNASFCLRCTKRRALHQRSGPRPAVPRNHPSWFWNPLIGRNV